MKNASRIALVGSLVLMAGGAASQEVFFPPNILLPNNETIAIGTV